MHNFKKIFPRLILLLVFVFLLEKGVRFLYEPYDQYSIYANREYQENIGKIDTLFLGTSRTYSSCDPAVYDELMNANSFNMGTGSQSITDSYFILKDALRLNPIKTVYLEVSVPTLKKIQNDSSTIGSFNRVSSLFGKLEMASAAQKNGLQMRELFFSTRVSDYFDFDAVVKNVSYKLSSDRNTPPQMPKNDPSYLYKGFISSSREYTGKMKTTENKSKHRWSRSSISSERMNSLLDIIDLCQKNEVELILFSPPITENFLSLVGDIDDMHACYQTIADTYGIRFFDMNLYKNKNEVFPNSLFRDRMHMNIKGAETFTGILAELTQSGTDFSRFFNLQYCAGQ
jgi:hypothetical protein